MATDASAAAYMAICMATLGLVIGSFLNVLIHRLPIMIEAQCAGVPSPLNLLQPGSHCPACQHPIGWADKWPLLSFIALRGRCRHCQTRISWQYPAVECAGALIFAAASLSQPNWASALAWAGFGAALLALAVIDARTQWLPDALTQPLLWGGLVASAWGLTSIDLHTSLAGAVTGYLSLWTVYALFLWATGKHGMGHGDFKLLAALGAWLGWQALPALVLLASLGALAGAGVQWARGRWVADQPLAFGHWLGAAGGLLALWGQTDPLAGLW